MALAPRVGTSNAYTEFPEDIRDRRILPTTVQNASNNGTPMQAPAPNQVPQPTVANTQINNTQHLVEPQNPLVTGYASGNGAAANTTNLPPATSLQEEGNTNPLATDTMGSRLVEALQGQRTTQQEEMANRLAAMGIQGGQASSALARADRDFGFGMSQGLGQFNIQRLQQAANINRDFMQLELARQLGLGNLDLSSQQLDAQIALRLAEMAQSADERDRNTLIELMRTYFGGDINPINLVTGEG